MEKSNNKSIESIKILKDKNDLTNKVTKYISMNVKDLSKQTKSIGEILNDMLSILS